MLNCEGSSPAGARNNRRNSLLRPWCVTPFIEVCIAVTVSFALFHTLWTAWSTGRTFFFSIGGYLPWSDASSWFNGGFKLLFAGKVGGLEATRIINETFVAALLAVSHENLQGALILRTALIALAVFLFLREVAYRLGIPCAATTAIAMIAFIDLWTPTMMTEPTGFLFGTLGATLLLLGTDDRAPQLFSAGLFLLVLALAARPGPFFVLPILVVWAGRCFRETEHFAMKPMLWSAAGVASGFAFAALLHRLYAVPGTVPFNDFAYSLYGLAKGGQSWSVFFSDVKHFPSGKSATSVAMEQAIAMIRADPIPFLTGMWSFVIRFLANQFIYISGNTDFRLYSRYGQWWRAPFVLFEIIALTYALRPGRTKIEELCALTFAGCVLSSAVTFSEAWLVRIFASTNAIQALLAGLGARAVVRTIHVRPASNRPHASSAKATLCLSGIIVLFLILIPLGAAFVGPLSASSSGVASWCSKNETPMLLDLGRSSPFLRITPPGSRTFIPDVAEGKFLQDKTFNDVGIARKLATLHQGDLFVDVFDISSLNVGTVWLIVHGAMRLAPPARYRVCANKEDIPTQWGLESVFTAEKVEQVER